MRTPREMQRLYQAGQNICAARRAEFGVSENSSEIIELAYDLQTGSYINAVVHGGLGPHKADYSLEIARRIQGLFAEDEAPASILEVGCGEATTLSGVISNLPSEIQFFGFDLSWSRAFYARNWLHTNGIRDCWLGTGDLFHMPFLDRSIDVVYTSHSIEPNGGQEEPILRELLRVARRYVVLLEPGYEITTPENRRRMDFHGYCRGLPRVARALGANVVCHESFPFSANPENPTALTIIAQPEVEKASASGRAVGSTPTESVLACPRYKTPLRPIDEMLYSDEALVVYPTIGGIPCLRIENGILASKFVERAEAGGPIKRPGPQVWPSSAAARVQTPPLAP